MGHVLSLESMNLDKDQTQVISNTSVILNAIVSDSYYGMLRGQISIYLPREHPIIVIWNNECKMASVSLERSTTQVLV